MPDFELERAYLEKKTGAVIAGIDEAGRGPWAGPVVAAAVVLEINATPQELCSALDDSKKLTAARREEIFDMLRTCDAAAIGVGHADVQEIDSLNILNATYRAMSRAVDVLGRNIDLALVDGNGLPPLPCNVMTVVKGDGKSFS
ncbi:MAG: ribonuclease HII, partial [Rhodospirillaceae bacterium]